MLTLSPTFRRELALGPDVVDVNLRLAVPISNDVAESLLRHCRDAPPWITADSIAWDLRRLFGDACGFDLYFDATWLIDRNDEVDQSAAQATWATFARPRIETDRLLINIADDARWESWKPPPEIAASLDRLADAAEAASAARESSAEKIRQAEMNENHAAWSRWLEWNFFSCKIRTTLGANRILIV